MLGHRGTELRRQEAGHLRDVHDGGTPLLVRVGEQHDVAVLRRHGVQFAEQPAVGPVVGEHVVAAVLDAGGDRLQLPQHRAQRRGDARALRTGSRIDGPGEEKRWLRSLRSSSSARASASRTWGETWMSRACSSQVYQVTPTAESWATSSRRSPGVRLRRPRTRPTCSGVIRSRRLRRKSASSCRRISVAVVSGASVVSGAAVASGASVTSGDAEAVGAAGRVRAAVAIVVIPPACGTARRHAGCYLYQDKDTLVPGFEKSDRRCRE